MNKKYMSMLLLLLVGFVSLNLFPKEEVNSDLTVVKVAEVAHTIFYAPQYVAMSKGFFEEEGLLIDLTLTSGANNVMAAVLSNEVDIGLSGSEATLYVYNGNEKDYVQTFAGLTNKDGSFIVGRTDEDFSVTNLLDKYVIGGRVAGMPQMTLEWILKENGIDINTDLTVDTSIDFAATSGAFISGIGDYVTLFEPTATMLENSGNGYVLASVGSLGGNVPYTAYNARTSYIENNQDIIEKFNNVINRSLEYVNNTDSSVIASDIISFFPDTTMEDIITIIDRYKSINAWKENTTITEEEFILLQDIMINSNELDGYVDYNDLIYSKLFTK